MVAITQNVLKIDQILCLIYLRKTGWREVNLLSSKNYSFKEDDFTYPIEKNNTQRFTLITVDTYALFQFWR